METDTAETATAMGTATAMDMGVDAAATTMAIEVSQRLQCLWVWRELQRYGHGYHTVYAGWSFLRRSPFKNEILE